ncbi:hypothetical protein J1605_000449 [Eschrichtius robustus]|uniref:Uncharacterized protein n=1 Tax=Eschrichtius robustus TaxID=9764 RepID=A0AB34H8X5_ESCRO|nr:hypothetical protein J1605_000449 [Eschrichtius robustus]
MYPPADSGHMAGPPPAPGF